MENQLQVGAINNNIQPFQQNQQQESDSELRPSYNLPDANPIQKRQKLQTYSIFPLHSLPKFNYHSDVSQPTIINDSVALIPQKFTLQSSSLKQLFKDPVYVYNSRALAKNNSDFGCIKVQYSQSSRHHKLKNPETIQDYIRLNKINKNSNQQFQMAERIVFQDRQNEVKCQNKINQQLKTQNKQQIFFQSRFQSGNLCFAALSSNSQEPTYYLICSRDMNTSKCTQWFFFKTLNRTPGKVTFHILNFIKSYSIFQSGMKICYANKSNGYKWNRGCFDIKYRQTNIPINSKRNDKFYYALTFSYIYNSPEDNVYFAYCYPYTYSMLQQLLFHKLGTNPYMKRRNIAITPGNNNVDLITISNFKQKQYKKRIVFITSRVHPGQTPSSFICEGMIKFLLGDTQEAKTLRDCFVFKFVPMLNPDGVINGSYRCSLAGYDLNRVWHKADKTSHPQIYGTRKAVYQTIQNQKIFIFADLHAHSKKKGIFAYGCQSKSNPYLCRQIPFLFWKNMPDFNYYQCNFMMKTGRQGTSRLYNYRQHDIDYSYTIQHSFCGPSKDRVHYTAKDYNKIGVGYLQTFFKKFQASSEMQIQIFQELYANKQLIKVGQVEQCSSSDEQLDKQKAPTGISQNKIQRKAISKRQTLRMSDGAIKSPKQTSSNFRKINFWQGQVPKTKQFNFSRQKETPNFFGETIRQLPIVNATLKLQYEGRIEQQATSYSYRQRICSSSLTNHLKPESSQKKSFMRQTFRYEQQQEVNSLTNLFLPSLTRASYKKYSRKNSSPKNMVHIGANLIQNAIILKQQIKAAQKKKPNWKQQARSYL